VPVSGIGWRTDQELALDAGDYGMGTAFSDATRGTGGELRLMGKMGCYATTFGNHEFDLGTGPEQVHRRYCQGGSHPGGATLERPHSHGDDSWMRSANARFLTGPAARLEMCLRLQWV
jgi:hypothetical protein